jgi:hypothetical protein
MRIGLTGLGFGGAGAGAGAGAFSLSAITVGLWDAADLASQTESDASAPEVGDQVYTANDVSDTPVWGDLARQSVGPTLRADGTSYYWENTNTGLGKGYTPGTTVVDVFMVVRKQTDALGYLFCVPGGSRAVGYWSNSDTSGPPYVNAGTPTITVNSGSALTTRDALHDALEGAGWVIFRAASCDLSSWVTTIRFPNITSIVDISLVAIVPSATLATGTNLTDTLAVLDARIAELNSAPSTVQAIASGYWLAEDLASQTESDASAPEVADEVYTVNDISVAQAFGQASRGASGPTLATAGTGYYWDHSNTSTLTLTRTPAALTADVFVIVRNANNDTNADIVSNHLGSNLISILSGSTGAISAYGGTCTVDGGSARADMGQLYTAIGTSAWKLVRLAGADLSTLDGLGFVRGSAAVQIAAVAVIPSATLAIGNNLTDTLAEFNAIIARLNA